MYEGVLNVYKERGFTSHDVVAKLRGILKMKKIGHTGTLDPDAEGVLPVCLGQATRLCDMLTDEGKVYRAVMLLGVETDTQDSGGRVLAYRTVAPAAPEEKPPASGAAVGEDAAETAQQAVLLSEGEVTEAVRSFVGPYDQIPPMYSALKVNGKKLYELARQGKTVERRARPVVIHRIDIETIELPRVTMTVHCSKGTYIRTLCHDIGRKLGCGACMESLLRVRVGRFRVEESLRLAQVEQLRDSGGLARHIVPVEAMFAGYPAARALPEADGMANNGNPLGLAQVRFGDGPSREFRADAAAENGREYRVYDSRGVFLGIYAYEQERDRLKPRKLFLAGGADQERI